MRQQKTVNLARESGEKFESPSALRQFAIETASQLRQAGLSEAGEIMESAAGFVTSSGWEWLGELGAAAMRIRERFQLPEHVGTRVNRIHKAATSQKPYGRERE
jgi:hypothetical protein